MKRTVIFGLFLVLILTAPASAFTGARSWGLGGVYVAVPIGASEVAGNPAMLGKLNQQSEVAAETSIQSQSKPGYLDAATFFGFTTPVTTSEPWLNGTLGVAIDLENQEIIGHYRANPTILNLRNQYFSGSYGLNPFDGLYVGATARWFVNSLSFTYDAESLKEEKRSITSDWGLAWNVTSNICLGAVLRNAPPRQFTLLDEYTFDYYNDLRIGASWQVADNILLALDVNDVLGKSQSPAYRRDVSAGAEFQWTKDACLRVGLANINSKTDFARAITAGFGLAQSLYGLGVDYALLYFTEAPESNLRHLVALSYKF